MKLYDKFSLQTPLALLLILSTLLGQSFADNDRNSSIERPPSHLSWTINNTRFDFVFKIEDTIGDLNILESDANNFLTNSLPRCANYSACLFRNGTFLESFHANNNISHESTFISDPSNQTTSGTQCDIGNKLKIVHYCSTHWNVPVFLTRNNCSHIIEWHSPLRCPPSTVNHERPCYTYDSSGKLIDLTSWIISNGSSYDVDLKSISGNIKVKNFRVNICNEAHDACGPNVASCYVDEQAGLIESGYNNLTSLRYNNEDKSVILTSLGHYKKQCEGERVKTVIRFTCKSKLSSQTGPRLIRLTACEGIVEWPTVKACPVSNVSVPATECKINYEPLGIEIDIMKLTSNRNTIEVPNISLNGVKKKMILGICKGLPKTLRCESKIVSTTNACLVNETRNPKKTEAKDSQIVGSVITSFIRLADDRIYMESFAPNKTCSNSIGDKFNVTQKVGTRLEFFCSPQDQQLPTFLGYDDCTYVFEWGTPLMCLETFMATLDRNEKSTETKHIKLEDEVDLKHGDIKNIPKSESRKKELSRQEEKPINFNTNDSSKMNTTHKYFMIGLILMSFIAFIVVIFVLDKKTRLRITLRRARQAFQPNQQPYSRVVNDLDL